MGMSIETTKSKNLIKKFIAHVGRLDAALDSSKTRPVVERVEGESASFDDVLLEVGYKVT